MRLWRAACLAAVSWARFISPLNSTGPPGEILSLSGHSLAESERRLLNWCGYRAPASTMKCAIKLGGECLANDCESTRAAGSGGVTVNRAVRGDHSSPRWHCQRRFKSGEFNGRCESAQAAACSAQL